MNRVVLAGRLTRDPETKTSGSVTYSRFSVAVDRRFKKEGQPEADFPNCVAFGKTAEFLEKYFHKGMRIVLEGRIQTGRYDDKDGKTVYTTDVVADNVEFGESKRDSGTTYTAPAPQVDSDGFMDIPEGEGDELPFD